ncbi:hypothetical protein MLD38_020238 [Melastoma candidum]|uniref:Uncharacterized protein n=1 Tax=Melastoma candidum TaxID=119954 RepID=A0ACB9QCT2_9MYRT|nr:hypothetical protein MLD38_020238 [Melastoma candidum]
MLRKEEDRDDGTRALPPLPGGSSPASPPSAVPAYPVTPRSSPRGSFSVGRINLGEIEVHEIIEFELVWDSSSSTEREGGVSFYRPVRIPAGFFCLGHCCEPKGRPPRGSVLVARESTSFEVTSGSYDRECEQKSPALRKPLDFTLVWSSEVETEGGDEGRGYIWLPEAPDGYTPLGYLVTKTSAKPGLEEVRVARLDLTDACEKYRLLFDAESKSHGLALTVWSSRPLHRGIHGKGVPVGTFLCDHDGKFREGRCHSCLKNMDVSMHAMPTLDQVHSLINHYGPTIFFHPDEEFLPSSVPWFFKAGALLFKQGQHSGEHIDANGSNLPLGGCNDGEYWIDLPRYHKTTNIKRGNLDSAVLYVHVKPALGGTSTDVAMWVFFPFNGPATLKLGIVDIGLGKIGQHVGDWEHFTLRISNFTGELQSIYFSQHSGGQWVDTRDLEFVNANKAAVYSSKGGHASFPRPGTYLQGSNNLGIGIRNDAAHSDLKLDSSMRYEIVAAEYLGEEGNAIEPPWLNYMRTWGPAVVYGSRNRLDRIMNALPRGIGGRARAVLGKLPAELSGEEGPTGPKEKNNWEGDERG